MEMVLEAVCPTFGAMKLRQMWGTQGSWFPT
jgi:hypothetical protein